MRGNLASREGRFRSGAFAAEASLALKTTFVTRRVFEEHAQNGARRDRFLTV